MDDATKKKILDGVTRMLGDARGLDGTLAVDRTKEINIGHYTDQTVIQCTLTIDNDTVRSWCQNTDVKTYTLRDIWDAIESTTDSRDVIIILRAMCTPVQYEYLLGMQYEDGYLKLMTARTLYWDAFRLAVQ